MNSMRRGSWGLIAATALLGCASAAPAAADVRIGVGIQVAPPAPRVVVVPAARRGYVWAPGFWRWTGRRHVWIDGRWLRERPGRVWVADHWDRRDRDWRYVPGHWERH